MGQRSGKVAIITGAASGIGQAAMAPFLTGDRSSFIDGQTICWDGGFSAIHPVAPEVPYP